MPFVEGSEQPEEDFMQNSAELEAPRLNYKNGSPDSRLTLLLAPTQLMRGIYLAPMNKHFNTFFKDLTINQKDFRLPTLYWKGSRMASSCSPPNVEIVSTYPARLNGDNNEIRLITILPERNNSNLVECNIDIFSLLHEKHDYKGFVKSYNSTVRARELLRQWYQSCSSSSDEQSVPKYPRTDFHRFSWGDFAALSYTWGDQTCMKNARINGQIVEITQNLEEVMKQLRENGQFGNSFKIWIDQLCINQSDDVERTAQVSKMREIYSRAWSVIAWLGCEKDDSAKAIAFMDKLADYSRQSTTELRDVLAIDPRFVEQGTWLGLKLLSDRPYWCRLWIVQELALGAADVVLVCGKDSIDWERFMAGREQFETLWQVKDRCIQIDRLALNPADKRSWAGANGLHHMSKELWKLSKIEKKGSEAASLRVLLEVANFSKCFDERDKVFGMLGVMDPKIALHLSPNYALKPVDVFTMTARAYIAEYHNLEILREGNPWGKASAPSWVPDWSWDGRLRDNSIPGPAFRADGINDPYIAYPSQEVLSCHAVLFDKIDGLGAQGSGMLNFLRETVIQPRSH